LRKPTPLAAIRVSTIASQMFMFTSVARMPIIRPAEPVMTPADRSNSPPIIRMATATAGIPIVDATSVQLEMPSSFRNSEFCVQKKIATTTHARNAPISGRRMRRDIALISVSRSSAIGWGGGGSTSAGGEVGGACPDAMWCLLITSLSSEWAAGLSPRPAIPVC
jgi:hypothetical protein